MTSRNATNDDLTTLNASTDLVTLPPSDAPTPSADFIHANAIEADEEEMRENYLIDKDGDFAIPDNQVSFPPLLHAFFILPYTPTLK